MDMQFIFWVLIVVTAFELLTIYMLGNTISLVLKSDVFKKKLERKRLREEAEEKAKAEKKDSGGKPPLTILTLVLLALTAPALAYGAETNEQGPFYVDISSQMLYILVVIDLLLLAVILYLKDLLKSFLNIDKTEEELAEKKTKAKRKMSLVQVLTDAVPVEEEAAVETDHEYDGIRELDNNLPPWWKYGFYLSIAVGVVYLLNYHVFKTGDLQVEAYHKEIAQAEVEIQAYLEAQAMNVDENSVTLMTDAADLNVGSKLFMKYCKVCHGGEGEGLVGPNLTDRYWIYGGKINNLFKTIKYGAERGMKSWKDELNPIQMQQVASFIKTLEGTTPANPKEPEGELYQEEEMTEPVDTVPVALVTKN